MEDTTAFTLLLEEKDLTKPLNPNRIGNEQDLKEGFALHCSRPLANR